MSSENEKKAIFKICIYAIFMAIAYIATVYIAFPIPFGYVNLGGSIILFAGFYLGGKAGFMVGGLGSALADLSLGYAVWAPFSFVVKGCGGLLAGLGKKEEKALGVKNIVKAVLAMAVVVIGYIISGMIIQIISGASFKVSVFAGLATGPALGMEALVNLLVYIMLVKAAETMKFRRILGNRK